MLPNDIESSFEQDFHFPENRVFCQLATQSNNYPRVRTVRLYGLEKDKGLIFITRTTLKKWNELSNNPNMAVCFLHPDSQIQLRAECKVNLFNDSLATSFVEKYWNMVNENVRKTYHDNYDPNVSYQQPRGTLENIPECFGLIIAEPYFWEYLFIDSNYANSLRYVYTKDIEENWVKERLTIF